MCHLRKEAFAKVIDTFRFAEVNGTRKLHLVLQFIGFRKFFRFAASGDLGSVSTYEAKDAYGFREDRMKRAAPNAAGFKRDASGKPRKERMKENGFSESE